MERKFKFVARSGFMVREVAGEQLLIPINTDNVQLEDKTRLSAFNGMIRLNDLGLFLWKKLDRPASLEELTEAVEEQFDTEGQNVRGDIAAFLETGIKNQLIFLISKEND